MFSHIRKQHQVQREKEKSLAQSKSKKRVFGDFRWDYIKSCKHELGSDSCPLCKLTSSAGIVPQLSHTEFICWFLSEAIL